MPLGAGDVGGGLHGTGQGRCAVGPRPRPHRRRRSQRRDLADRRWSLADLGGIARRWHEPQPVFAGLDKKTYRLQRAPRWQQVDIGLFPQSATTLFNQPERHGHAQVLVDDGGRCIPPAWDAEAHLRAMRVALHHEIMKFRIYEGFFRKELQRDRTIDAFRMHQAMTVRPLVAVLGMLHRPTTWGFETRYLHDDLPQAAADAIYRMCYVADPSQLEARFEEAVALFAQTVAALQAAGITPLDAEGDDILA